MNLNFNQYGDLSTKGGALVNSTEAEVQLGRFMFYAAVNRGNYKYDINFGNTLYKLFGKVKTTENLKLIQKYLDKDILQSSVFTDIDTEIEVYGVARNKVAVKIIGVGMDASWDLVSSKGVGINLLSFNDGTVTTPIDNIVASEVMITVDGQLSYDITNVFFSAIDKNNLASL